MYVSIFSGVWFQPVYLNFFEEICILVLIDKHFSDVDIQELFNKIWTESDWKIFFLIHRNRWGNCVAQISACISVNINAWCVDLRNYVNSFWTRSQKGTIFSGWQIWWAITLIPENTKLRDSCQMRCLRIEDWKSFLQMKKIHSELIFLGVRKKILSQNISAYNSENIHVDGNSDTFSWCGDLRNTINQFWTKAKINFQVREEIVWQTYRHVSL